MTNPFHFKQFTIQQENAAMKVGTDSVLLGAWANLEDASSILDIGSGTGLLAIMAAQRNKHAQIDAVEIDSLACKDAALNVKNCPWRDRITLHSVSIFDYKPAVKYEHIISNPPFFSDSLLCPDALRTKARHCERFTHVELMKKVRALLQEDGKFSLVLPVDKGLELIEGISSYHFYLSRMCFVYPTFNKTAKRILLEFSILPSAVKEEKITVEQARYEYTKEYSKLTEVFYLNI